MDQRFGRALHQTGQWAERIHVVLDGIPDTMIPAAVCRGRAGFFVPKYTNTKWYYIAMHPALVAKTILYRHGRVGLTPRFLA